MRTATIAIALLCAATMGATSVEAKPGGCLKYGAAGAVAVHRVAVHRRRPRHVLVLKWWRAIVVVGTTRWPGAAVRA